MAQITLTGSVGLPTPSTDPRVTGVALRSPPATVYAGGGHQFVADVAGSGNPSRDVTWSVQSGGGSINQHGFYFAPNAAGGVTVRAASAADNTRFVDHAFTVDASKGVGARIPNTTATFAATGTSPGGEGADKAFDGLLTTVCNVFGSNPAILRATYPSGFRPVAMEVVNRDSSNNRDPKDFEYVVSNDGGSTWAVAGSITGFTFPGVFATCRLVATANTGTAYTTHGIRVTASRDGVPNEQGVGIVELRFFSPDAAPVGITPQATAVVVTPIELAAVAGGQTRQMLADVYGTTNPRPSQTVSWSTTVGTISPNGFWTPPETSGAGTITATQGGLSKSIPVTVAAADGSAEPPVFAPAPTRDFKAWMDDFEVAGAPDARKWLIQSFNSSTSTTGASAANNSGQARMTLPANAAATTVIGYTTSDNLDIRDQVVYARFDGFSSNVTGVEAYMQVGHDGSNRLRIAAVAGGGAFTAATILGGTGTTVQTATYVGATHRWWGLRYITGTNTIEFLCAASGDPDTTGPGPWTVFHSMPCPSQINPAAVRVAFEGRTAAAVATPGYVSFGAFNTKMVTAPALAATLNPPGPLSLATGGAQQQVVGVITGGDGSPSQYGTYSITGTATVDAAGIVTPPATGATSGKLRFTPFADASKFVETDYTVSTPLAAPAAPTGLGESSITQTAVTLAWTLGSGGGALAAVKLRYRVQGASSWTTVTLGASATTHPLSGLTPGTTYEWAPGGSNATADTFAPTDTFTTAAPAGTAPAFTTPASLPSIAEGEAMAVQLVTTGDTPQTFTILSGAPAGMAVASSTGMLTWPDPESGTYSAIAVQSTNATGSATRVFSLTVEAAQVQPTQRYADSEPITIAGVVQANAAGWRLSLLATDLSAVYGTATVNLNAQGIGRIAGLALNVPVGAVLMARSPDGNRTAVMPVSTVAA